MLVYFPAENQPPAVVRPLPFIELKVREFRLGVQVARHHATPRVNPEFLAIVVEVKSSHEGVVPLRGELTSLLGYIVAENLRDYNL